MANKFKRKFGRKKFVKRIPAWKKMLNLGLKKFQNVPGPLGYAIKGVNMLKDLVNTEAKYLEGTTAGGAITTTGQVTPLSLMAQGTDDGQRIGQSILVKSVNIHLQCISFSATSVNEIRVILFCDKQNAAGTAPTMANLLSAADARAFYNVNFTERFVVLHDKTIDVNGTGDASMSVKIYKNIPRLHTKYDGTTAVQASLAENGLYLGLISSDGVNGPTVNGRWRLAYYDN